jgi:hypothetical protein
LNREVGKLFAKHFTSTQSNKKASRVVKCHKTRRRALSL